MNTTTLAQAGVLRGTPLQRQHALLRSRPARGSVRVSAGLFDFWKKQDDDPTSRFGKAARDEQWRAQQEILARRKTNSWQKDVEERRAKVSRFLKDPEFKKQCEAENREKFLAARKAEGPEPTKGIIIPLIPIGLPEYDGGERFDLRLPYVDNGWVDDDADMGRQIGRLFGLGNKDKQAPQAEGGKGGKKKR